MHLGIIGEWRGYGWRPVLPWSEIRSLVDEDGFLRQSSAEFWKHNLEMSELEKEFRAQIDLAKKKGVRVDYLDTHFIMPYDFRFRPLLERISKDYGIPVSGFLGERGLPDFGIYSSAPEEKEKVLAGILENLEPGVHLLIAHRGYPSLENDELIHSETKDVKALGVGKLRAAEMLAYTSPQIQRLVESRGIRLTSYRDFCNHLNIEGRK